MPEKEVIPARIIGLRIDSLKGNIGSSSRKIWQSPARLNFIASIVKDNTSNYDRKHILHFSLKNKGELIQDGIRFIHEDEGLENPCFKHIITGTGIEEAVFTAEVSKPGKHNVTIGNSLDSGFTTSFEIVEEYDPAKHG